MRHACLQDRRAGRLARRQLRVEEELWMDHGGQAFRDREPQHESEWDQGEHCQRVHQTEPPPAGEPAQVVAVHAASRASREIEWTRGSATTLTTRVTRMRTSPSSTSAAG